MAGGNYSQGFSSVRVDGRRVEELVDFDMPALDGAAVDDILAAGMRSIGHKFTTKVNNPKATFSIACPSSDEAPLEKLNVLKTTTTMQWSYEDDTELPLDSLISVSSSNVKLQRNGSYAMTDDRGAIDYTLHCIGYTLEFKGGKTISVDAEGNATASF